MTRNPSLVLQSLYQVSRKRIWHRSFHASSALAVVKPFLLADIGEGITEVQIIQWFVQPGARVQQFDKLCEVQSDKASVEITSRFDGVIKKLHYEQDDTAKVGRALFDIDIEGDISPQDEVLVTPEAEQAGSPDDPQQPQKAPEKQQGARPGEVDQNQDRAPVAAGPSSREPRNRHTSSLATPAVRGVLERLNVNIEDVEGTGRDGRVLKEDVHNFVAARTAESGSRNAITPIRPYSPTIDLEPQKENPIALTPIQAQMFKVMTHSLSIPHFLYADEVDLSALSALRQRLKSHPLCPGKISFLPFVIKAVSLALHAFPLLNARVEVDQNDSRPKLIMREKHNIGVAIDTPQGLLVPNIKNVAALSIRDIAEQLVYLQEQAQSGKLSTTELTGGTITVSNIGNVGGTYVAPVIVQSEVAILGMGKARTVPAFGERDQVVKKLVGNFSWSADHRVVDGATMARMGERVRMLIEEPGVMLADMR